MSRFRHASRPRDQRHSGLLIALVDGKTGRDAHSLEENYRVRPSLFLRD